MTKKLATNYVSIDPLRSSKISSCPIHGEERRVVDGVSHAEVDEEEDMAVAGE